MATTTLRATTVTQSGFGTNWSNLSGAASAGTSTPAYASGYGSATNKATLTNWTAMPGDAASVNSVTLEGDAWASSTFELKFAEVDITINSTSSGDVSSTLNAEFSGGYFGTSPQQVSLADPVAGVTLSDLAAGITLNIVVNGSSDPSSQAKISNWGLLVDYTRIGSPPPPPNSEGTSSPGALVILQAVNRASTF